MLERGHNYIGEDDKEEIIGAFVITFGTPYRQYIDIDTVQVNIALLRSDYRHTSAFIIGMTAVMEGIEQTGRPVKEIHSDMMRFPIVISRDTAFPTIIMPVIANGSASRDGWTNDYP